ncbi:MAG: T9SS type A sorting domain-containing protein, partial [Bacteroidales bacterium]|nr:T9SS type A sorting domain-containing protein [Bacteroidales bacterium]
NLILRTGDSDKCILNNPVISSPTFASNSGMIVRRPITIGEGTALNIGGDLNVESGSITLSSTGALLVTGNANIASGASVAFDNKDTLSIAGNLVLEGSLDFPESDTTPALRLGGNLVIDGGSLDEGGTLVFAGSSTQNVSNGTSPLTLNNNVRMNMHRSRAGVPHTVFPDGTIFSKTTIFEYGIMDGNITFDANGRTIICGGYESYASGTVTKLGAGNNFTFPTGDDNVLGTITARIPADQNAIARFHHKSTDGGFSIEDGYPRWWSAADMCGTDPFNHVSNFEYWDFNSSAALSGVMFRTTAATAGEHFRSPSEYPDPDNPDNVIQVAVHDECWRNGGGTLSITPDFTEITISGVGVEARGTRGSAITSLGSKDPTVVLPIELLSFTATCNGNYAELAWSTASERNNDYFVIERSDDAIEFTEVGRVAGAGNSIEQLDYTYNDYGIHGGDNYYRLVQVDYDGTRTASEIIVANCIEPEVAEPDVQAYPNPFNDELTVVLDNFGNRAATIEVYDMLGKLIYTNKIAAPQNSYETILNLSNLPPAAYTVRVSTTDFVINRNVVKQ